MRCFAPVHYNLNQTKLSNTYIDFWPSRKGKEIMGEALDGHFTQFPREDAHLALVVIIVSVKSNIKWKITQEIYTNIAEAENSLDLELSNTKSKDSNYVRMVGKQGEG